MSALAAPLKCTMQSTHATAATCGEAASGLSPLSCLFQSASTDSTRSLPFVSTLHPFSDRTQFPRRALRFEAARWWMLVRHDARCVCEFRECTFLTLFVWLLCQVWITTGFRNGLGWRGSHYCVAGRRRPLLTSSAKRRTLSLMWSYGY